jgi:MFS family permease
MLGVVAAWVGLGTLVFSPLTHYLITRFGWRSAFLFLGIILGIMVAAGASAMVHSPEKKGLQPYGAEPSGPNTSGPGHGSHLNMTTARAMRTGSFAYLLAISAISTLPGLFLLGHLVAYATDKGISPGAAASALGLMGAFNVVGRLALGPLGERMGWMKAFAFSCFACALAMLWLIAVTELWMLYVFAIIYGFFWGGRLPPFFASVAWLFGTASLAELIGFTLAASVVVGAAAPFIAGFVFDHTGSYLPALIASIGFFAVGGILSLQLRPPRSRSL